jgi:hypothetical protein
MVPILFRSSSFYTTVLHVKGAICDKVCIKVDGIFISDKEVSVVRTTFLHIFFVLFRLWMALVGVETCSEFG